MVYYFMGFIVLAVLIILWITITGVATFHILLNKRDPRGAALWLAMTFFLPILGPLLYWTLGINRIKRSSTVRARRRSRPGWAHWRPEHRVHPNEGLYPELESLMNTSGRITSRPLLQGNTIEPLYEGNQTFPAMLTAIGSAERSVNLSTYILDRDAVGSRMISALCTAAQRGVEVRVLVDGIGTTRSAIVMARQLRGAGAMLSIFHPLFGLWVRRPSINMRNHRKLLIIDGRIGFTGGINISSRHFLTPWKKIEPIRDIHFRVTGPVLEQMQAVFAEDWHASKGELLDPDEFLAQPEGGGEALVRAVSSGPDEDLERIYYLILGALRSARDHVLIMTPYFIPDRALIQALSSAVLAGVRVEILLPEKSDHPLVQGASMANIPELIENGVKVLLIPPPFVHSKLMIVDEAWSLIGSANIDPRSFRLNFEFDLEIYSREFAQKMLQYSREMSSEGVLLSRKALLERPLTTRLLEGAVKIFSPYL
ncbi:MAG: cardiolipin synthase [bacterium]|nr:cardiolipin synthase [bacterium]MDT8367304.1 cardiolipin synthase [bacterium]